MNASAGLVLRTSCFAQGPQMGEGAYLRRCHASNSRTFVPQDDWVKFSKHDICPVCSKQVSSPLRR